MGIVTWGIPRQIVRDLARINGSTIFVETGTHFGRTTRWAAAHFEAVHTIERSDALFHRYSGELSKIKGVIPYQGDSRLILPQIVDQIHGRRAVYWLDGHWSGGETAGEQDECPLLAELACLPVDGKDIILIDDARLFLCAPPLPHDPSQWPTIPEILDALPAAYKGSLFQVVDDVIFIVPGDVALHQCLVDYGQLRSNIFWGDYMKRRKPVAYYGQKPMSFLWPSR